MSAPGSTPRPPALRAPGNRPLDWRAYAIVAAVVLYALLGPSSPQSPGDSSWLLLYLIMGVR